MDDSVVEMKDLGFGIARIRMQDRLHKNTFTEKLIEGLIEAFAKIRHTNYKAVILTGYGNYFASGGTQETLIKLSDGKGMFTDTNLYSLALECPIPVISAMQGHGIGGGFVFGLFADFVILSKESIYTANFMKYGFTPGMGATFILPKKLGISLAGEMLLSAKTYYGAVLQNRGVPFPVLRRSEIEKYALDLARTIAEKPRISLVTLKEHLVDGLRKELFEVINKEREMQEKTFHHPEVKNRIVSLFGK